MRSWQVERRKRTRHLIELGGLVVKAGIVDLTGDDRTIIYGALIWMIQSNMPVHVGHRLESAKIIPDAGQNPHHLLGAVVLKDAGG
ncbi:Conjugal transfer protein TraD [Paracoccus pantotrophus]|nr:Conjugal transfer protein TraD [Paracoccus pantotrophus]